MGRPNIDLSCPTDHEQCSVCLDRNPIKLMVLRIGQNHFAMCKKCRELLHEITRV